MTVSTATAVDLNVGHTSSHCLEMGWRLKRQLDPDYSRRAAIMDVHQQPRRTARKRAARAERLGYWLGCEWRVRVLRLLS